MSIDTLIAEIDAEIARLQQARTLLSGAASPAAKKRGRPANAAARAGAVKAASKPVKKKRNLSPEGRARIAAAVKARWAKVAAQKKAAAQVAAKAPAKAPAKAAAKLAKKAPTKKAPAKKVVAKKAPAKAVEPVESSTPQQ